MSAIHWLRATDPPDSFPAIERACNQPNGLLAAGGDLSIDRLLCAYRQGIFPWYEEGQPILWWSPDPRTVIKPADIHVSRSLIKQCRRYQPRISINTAFDQVIEQCALNRTYHPGTWITPSMKTAYQRLHRNGWAHSLEVWRADQLIGGIYGVAIGGVFFGESMFSAAPDGSKIALIKLARWLEKWQFALIDCQVKSAHLSSLGSIELDRVKFSALLAQHCSRKMPESIWEIRDNLSC